MPTVLRPGSVAESPDTAPYLHLLMLPVERLAGVVWVSAVSILTISFILKVDFDALSTGSGAALVVPAVY